MKVTFLLLAIYSLFLGLTSAQLKDLRDDALYAYEGENWESALQLYTKACSSFSDDRTANDIEQVVSILLVLEKPGLIDGFLEAQAKRHNSNFVALHGIAKAYWYIPHEAYKIHGALIRGEHKEYRKIYIYLSDHVKSLHFFESARQCLLKQNAPIRKKLVADFYYDYLTLFLSRTSARNLYPLTDPSKPEDPTNSHDNTLLFSEDFPLEFHEFPSSYEKATSDGERMMWILKEARAFSPRLANEVNALYAAFLEKNYHLTSYEKYTGNSYAVTPTNHQLADDEITIRYLNSKKGIIRKTVKVPARANFLVIYQKLFAEKFTDGIHLANHYLHRGQTKRALEILKESQKRNPSEKTKHLIQRITGEWVKFAPIKTSFPHNNPPKLYFFTKNIHSVSLSVRPIDTQKLEQAIITAKNRRFAKRLQKLGTELKKLGSKAIEGDLEEFIGPKVLTMDLQLKKREAYQIHKRELELALREAGTYLLTLNTPSKKSVSIVISLEAVTLVGKAVKDGTQYTAVDSNTGQPISGVLLSVCEALPEPSFSHEDIEPNDRKVTQFQRITNKSGQVTLPISDSAKELLLSASYRGWHSFLPLHHKQSLEELHTAADSDRIRGVIQTDRPVYKPGDTIHATITVRKPSYVKPDNTSHLDKFYHFFILDNNGEALFEKKRIVLDAFGKASVEIPTTAQTPTGLCSASVSQGNGIDFKKRFRIEQIDPPRFKVSQKLKGGSYKWGNDFSLEVEGQYLDGSPLGKCKGYVVMKVEPLLSSASRIEPYSWLFPSHNEWSNNLHRGIEDKYFEDFMLTQEFTLKEKGQTTVSFSAKAFNRLKTLIGFQASIAVVITDTLGEQQESHEVHEVYSKVPFIEAKWDSTITTTGEKSHLSVITPNHGRKGIPSKGSLKLYAITYKNNKAKQKLLKRIDFITNKDGEFDFSYKPSNDGKIEAEIFIEGNNRSLILPLYVIGKNPVQMTDQPLEIVAHTTVLKPNNSLQFVMLSNDPHGCAFLKNANQTSYTPVQLENYQSLQTRKTGAEDRPNFWLEAFLISNGQVSSKKQEIIIRTDDLFLELTAKLKEEVLEPQQENILQLELKDHKGRPVQGDLIVTIYDKALDLSKGAVMPYPQKDIWHFTRFFKDWEVFSTAREESSQSKQQEQLPDNWNIGFHHATLKSYFENRRYPERHISQHFERGGGGSFAFAPLASSMSKSLGTGSLRKDFRTLLHWSGSVKTDKNGRASIPFLTADALTTWQVRVWAIDLDSRIGSASTTFKVSKPLLIQPSLPKFLTEGDHVSLSALSINNETKDLEVSIGSLVKGESVKFLQTKTHKTSLAKNGGRFKSAWEASAPQPGEAKLQFWIKGEELEDAAEHPIHVARYGLPLTQHKSYQLSKNEPKMSIEIEVPEQIAPTSSSLSLNIGSSSLDAVYQAIPYLYHYEHGCAEQTLNRFLPAAMAKQLLSEQANSQKIKPAVVHSKEITVTNPSSLLEDSKIEEKLEESILRLRKLQSYFGHWGWFSKETEDPYISALVTYGLVQASLAKISLKEKMLNRAHNYLNSKCKERNTLLIENKKEATQHLEIDSYIGLALASFSQLQGHPLKDKEILLSYLKEIAKRHKNLSTLSLAQIAIAFHHLEKKEESERLIKKIANLGTLTEEKGVAFYCYKGTFHAETTAWVLKLLSLSGEKKELAQRLALGLICNRENGTHWQSTKDTAVCIAALISFHKNTELGAGTRSKISLNGKPLISSRGGSYSISIPHDHLAPGMHQLKVEHNGVAPLYLSSSLTYYSKKKNIAPISNKLKLSRKYFLIDPIKEAEYRDNWNPFSDHSDDAVAKAIAKYRKPLKQGDTVKPGDIIEVEFSIESPQNCSYLHLRDHKPAGMVNLKNISISEGGAFRKPGIHHMDLYIDTLKAGKSTLSYRLIAEHEGNFAALPAVIESMYSHSLSASSSSQRLGVRREMVNVK